MAISPTLATPDPKAPPPPVKAPDKAPIAKTAASSAGLPAGVTAPGSTDYVETAKNFAKQYADITADTQRKREAVKAPDDASSLLKPMPYSENTKPQEVWGSLAMGLAAFGGLLTRRPLTNSLNAAAGVMNAFKQRDADKAKQDLEKWKEETDQAIRVHQFQQDAYKDQMERLKEGDESAKGELTASFAALKDAKMLQHADMGDWFGVQDLYLKRAEAGMKFSEYSDLVHARAQAASGALEYQKANDDLQKAKASGDQKAIQDATDRVNSSRSTIFSAMMKIDPEAAIGRMFPVSSTGGTSPQAEWARKWWSEHPDASADEFAKAFKDNMAGSGGGQGGRAEMMTNKLSLAGGEIAETLKNIMELPETSRGVLGGSSDGTIMGVAGTALKNKVSPQEVQDYNVMISGLQRNLSAIEAAGNVPPGSLTHSMDSVVMGVGDTQWTKLRKMAEIRQIVEFGMKPILSDPKVPGPVKDNIKSFVEDIKSSVPFTNHDITTLEKNPRRTLGDIAGQHGLMNKIKVGTIEDGHRYKGGDPADPNSWEQVQ